MNGPSQEKKSPWFLPLTLEQLQGRDHGSMSEHLGIQITQLGPDFLEGTMPVDKRTKQPYGILHGGANCVLAETLGSIAANCCLDPEKQYAVGLEINANHIRSVSSGFVKGVARPLHLGKSTHVWEIKIYNENEKLACVSRLTMAILLRQQ